MDAHISHHPLIWLCHVFLNSSLPLRRCFSLTIWFSLSKKGWIGFSPIKSYPISFCPEPMRTEACALQGSLFPAATRSFWRASWAPSDFLALCNLDQCQAGQYRDSPRNTPRQSYALSPCESHHSGKLCRTCSMLSKTQESWIRLAGIWCLWSENLLLN